MNIDLFVTDHGEAGLIIDRAVKELPSGAILDAETNFMTLEFAQSTQTMHLNIPVEDDHKEKLLFSPHLHVAMMDDGMIADHRNIVLLYLNDPYGGEFGDMAHTGRPQRSLLRLEQFMKRCTFAQAVNRVDVGDEGTVGSVLQGVSPKSLQFAPQLAREVAMDATPRIQQQLGISHAPGPKGPGGVGGSTTRSIPQRPVQPPRRSDDDE
ncbi:MAG: hypothetical protein AAF569_01635 [Pseudomonadota bacterium]